MVGTLYSLLCFGGATVVYPFLIMLGSSITSQTDFRDYRIVPRYIYEEKALFLKHLHDKYEGDYFETVAAAYRLPTNNFETSGEVIRLPDVSEPRTPAFVEDWRSFKMTLPPEMFRAHFRLGWGGGLVQNLWQEYLYEKFDGDLTALNAYYQHSEALWKRIEPPFDIDSGRKRRDLLEEQKYIDDWREFKTTLPHYMRNPFDPRKEYHTFLRREIGTIEQLNQAWDADYPYYSQVPFPLSRPENAAHATAWEKFLRRKWPLRFLRIMVDEEAETAYREFLRKRYKTVAALNRAHKTDYGDFSDVVLGTEAPDGDIDFNDWADFVGDQLPLDHYVLHHPVTLYAQHLRERYGSIEAVNAAFGTTAESIETVEPPRPADDYLYFRDNRRDIYWAFISVNYKQVLSYILVQGRAAFNTLILVTAAIVGQLTVMPLAAFALSRFKLNYANRILLFLLATMAFPGEVAMIPNFLLLKELHLLNTYFALVLPGLANGFGVFLLKGFFDSLPSELYEAATIEGASELQMFRLITFPMSKPIFAVIALGAFGGAYGGFMWAFLICQKKSMWTLMVYLYDYQQVANPPFLIVASLVIAALPTLLVFIFCQKIIMRGIIIPTFK